MSLRSNFQKGKTNGNLRFAHWNVKQRNTAITGHNRGSKHPVTCWRSSPPPATENPATAKKLDIEPGKHKMTVKTPGADPETEEVEIAPDTTWGAIALPGGGALVVQVY